jgi:hypothetical protein
MSLRKQYVLINSDDRTSASRSTTDFNVVLREPINNVVKTDLVAVSMDYNMANITAPNNVFYTRTHAQLSAAVEGDPAYDEEIPPIPAVIEHHDAVAAETHTEVTVVAGWYFQALDTVDFVLLSGYSRTEIAGHYSARTGEDAGDYWNRDEESVVIVDVEGVEAYDEEITPAVDAETIHHDATEGTPAVFGEVTSSFTIDEEQYTATELRAALEQLLGGQDGYYDVSLVNRNLRIEYWFPDEKTTSNERRFQFVCTNATLRTILGMVNSPLTGSYVPTIGEFGGSRITFPRAIRLPATSPFIMIQSAELGIRTKTSSGLGFWRALINDPSTDTLQAANSRTDDYLDEPKRLQDIDIRLGFPNGVKVDNRGSAFAILIEVVTDEKIKRRTE